MKLLPEISLGSLWPIPLTAKSLYEILCVHGDYTIGGNSQITRLDDASARRHEVFGAFFRVDELEAICQRTSKTLHFRYRYIYRFEIERDSFRFMFNSREEIVIEGRDDSVDVGSVTKKPVQPRTRNKRFQQGTSAFSGQDLTVESVEAEIEQSKKKLVEVEEKLKENCLKSTPDIAKRNQLNRTIRYLRSDYESATNPPSTKKHLSPVRIESIKSKIKAAFKKRHPIAKKCQEAELERLRLERQRSDLKTIVYDGYKILQTNHINTPEESAAAAKDPIQLDLNPRKGLYDIDKVDITPIFNTLTANGRLGIGGCDDGLVYTKVTSYMGGRQALQFAEQFAIKIQNKFALLSGIFID